MRKRDIIFGSGNAGNWCRSCLGDNFNPPPRNLDCAAQAPLQPCALSARKNCATVGFP
jgi:hypothetical protein